MAISFQKLASFFVSIIEKEIPSIISESVFWIFWIGERFLNWWIVKITTVKVCAKFVFLCDICCWIENNCIFAHKC
jgi:hypothetical protein